MPKKKQKINFALVYLIVVCVIMVLLCIGSVNFFKTSRYFTVKDVVYFGIEDTEDIDHFLDMEGENLFRVDLRQIENDILKRYPEFRSVNVTRIFPNKIGIIIDMRKPIARVKLPSRVCLVDKEAKEILKMKSAAPEGLPLIAGFTSDSLSKNSLNSNKLSAALALINSFKESPGLGAYTISKIDVGDMSDASLFLNNGIQVKIGDEDFRSRLKMLAMLLKQVEQEIEQIKYIDLRFREPVVAKK